MGHEPHAIPSRRGRSLGRWVLRLVIVGLVGMGAFAWLNSDYVSEGTFQVDVYNALPSLSRPVEDIQSATCLLKALDLLGSSAEAWGINPDLQLAELQRHLRVSVYSGTDLIRVSVRSCDPVLAKDTANAVIHAYRDFVKARRQASMDESVAPLESAIFKQEFFTSEAYDMARNHERRLRQANAGVNSSPIVVDQEFVEAKEKYVAEYRLLQSLQLKLRTEQLHWQIPRAVVQVHEEPGLGRRVYFWNR